LGHQRDDSQISLFWETAGNARLHAGTSKAADALT
jgi:hypothetical protein